MPDSKEPLHNYVRYVFLYKFLYKRIWYVIDTCRESHFNILSSPFVLLKYFVYSSAIFLTISNTQHVTHKLRYLYWMTTLFVHSVTNFEIIISSTIRLRKSKFSQLNFFFSVNVTYVVIRTFVNH
jgi:hypothetical protein